MSGVTPLEWIIAVGVLCGAVLIVWGFWANRICRQEYQRGFENGWQEGWDDRDHDSPPSDPPYAGKHHVSAEQAEILVREFITAAEAAAPTVELQAVTLPKRTPKVPS